jgi:hypothetical protein
LIEIKFEEDFKIRIEPEYFVLGGWVDGDPLPEIHSGKSSGIL